MKDGESGKQIRDLLGAFQFEFGNVNVLTADFGGVFYAKVEVLCNVRYLREMSAAVSVMNAEAEPHML